jgi:hypothetical protein
MMDEFGLSYYMYGVCVCVCVYVGGGMTIGAARVVYLKEGQSQR